MLLVILIGIAHKTFSALLEAQVQRRASVHARWLPVTVKLLGEGQNAAPTTTHSDLPGFSTHFTGAGRRDYV